MSIDTADLLNCFATENGRNLIGVCGE